VREREREWEREREREREREVFTKVPSPVIPATSLRKSDKSAEFKFRFIRVLINIRQYNTQGEFCFKSSRGMSILPPFLYICYGERIMSWISSSLIVRLLRGLVDVCVTYIIRMTDHSEYTPCNQFNVPL